MGRSIDDYRKKRDFARTPEPGPDAGRGKRRGEPVFVVHRHEARRLHYDLRLEMEGCLRSWAVPKGFCYDPARKHLAIRTEDHPLRYESFEGLIPKGEYGAGSMTIWDRGVYEVLYASSGPEAVKSGELKIRLRGRKLRGEWHLVKTNQGEHHWLLFKSRDRYSGPDRDTALGTDLSAAPRRALPRTLRPMQAGAERAVFSDSGWIFEARLEGRRVLAEKKGDRVRLRGLRRKLPEVEEGLSRLRAQDALIEGVLVVQDEGHPPSRERLEERLSGKGNDPVLLYAFDLLYFDEFDLRALPLIDRKVALRGVLPATGGVLFLDHVPASGERLAEAAASAGIAGLVAKRAESRYEAGASEDWALIPLAAAAAGEQAGQAQPRARGRKQARGRKTAARRVKLSNLGKVFWPREGYTKGDLIAYYEAVADHLLPYLHDRPVHLNRFPDGIEGKSFYQRQAKEGTPEWVLTEKVESDSHGGPVPHVLCNDRDTLFYLVNSGSIDLHPWLSRRGSLDSPDWAILDLDPKGAPFRSVVRIAREIGKLLQGIGLRPLLKTSGSTGLHAYVPLQDGYTYDQARMFCEGVARVIVRELGSIATVERAIESREGKVYVDFGQNRRGQTVVPPYVPRPVPGARVSTPLSWDELEGDLDPSGFTILTVPERLQERGDLFRPALTDRQDLLPAIAELERYLRGP